jgi:hypothetical protein
MAVLSFTALKDFTFDLLRAAAAWLILVACSVHAQEDAHVSEEAAEPSSHSRKSEGPPAPVLSVDRTESAPEDRPVLSVNQTERNESDADKPVLFLDPSGPTPAQSPLEEGEGISPDQTAVPEEDGASKPTDEKGIQERKKWGLQFRSRVGIAYDDNIFISNTNRVADTILTVTEGICLSSMATGARDRKTSS